MGAIPSGKGGERFPQLPPQRPDLEGSGGWGGRRRRPAVMVIKASPSRRLGVEALKKPGRRGTP